MIALETRRKLFHLILGTILALLYYTGFFKAIYLMYILILGLLLLLCYKHLPVVYTFLKSIERKRNFRFIPGVGFITYMLGSITTVYLFDPHIATAALLILAWADSLSGLLGRFGSHPYFNKKKTWEGLIAGILGGSFASLFFVPILHAFITTTILMFLEGLDLHIYKTKIDDNLLIPILSGTILTLLA